MMCASLALLVLLGGCYWAPACALMHGEHEAHAAEVLFVTEALRVQGEGAHAPGRTPTRPDGSCPCPGHVGRSFCPLDSSPGQCDQPTHKSCKLGGHCAAAPPEHTPNAVPISTMNPSVTVTENGTVILMVQAEFLAYKNQQRPIPNINMISSTDNGRSWSNVSKMGPPGAPGSLYSTSSKTLFLFGKSANMLDNGTRPELPDTCYQSRSTRPGDPNAW